MLILITEKATFDVLGQRPPQVRNGLGSKRGRGSAAAARTGAGCAATIALVAGGYLVMTTPDPAASENSSEARQGGWLAQVRPSPRPAEDDDVPELLRPGLQKKKTAADPAAITRKEELIRPGQQKNPQKKKTADKTADPAARNHGNVAGEADLFRPDPQYDKKY